MSMTHMGQRPSDHVTLESSGGSGDNVEFVRIKADGSKDPVSPWRVPAGKVLVVTDVDWQYNSADPGSRQTFRIFIVNLSSGESERVFESTVMLNDSGDGGISEGMTSGFVISSAGGIEVDVSPGGGRINRVIIRGYLCRDS